LALLKASLVALLSGAGDPGPDYPLGPLRLPPIADAATPFRVADLRYSFTDDGGTFSSFDARLRAGGSLFVGAEVRGDRRGLFLDTQRIELGLSEENGDYELEGSYRAPWFLVGTRVVQEQDEWEISASGSLRFSKDLEVLFAHDRDLDESVFVPGPLEDFVRSGVLPDPAPPGRQLRGTSVSLLYQRGNHFEALLDVRGSRFRTEAGFDLDVERYGIASLWNPERSQIEGAFSYSTTSGRISSQELDADLAIDAELTSHLLASASTSQRWEPGVLRFEDAYRVGATFFGRRHRFERRSEAAARVLELQRQANALGYNERRVYDVDGLRRFRERLGISRARLELKEALDELYRAQVRERNVPQLGFELEMGEDSIRTVDRRGYRAFVGIPWPLRLPFLRSEDAVEFLLAEFLVLHEDYGGGLRAVTREAALTAFLNREISLFVRYRNPGITPDEVILERSAPSTFTVGFEYLMGR
jgi:hypothetical protein